MKKSVAQLKRDANSGKMFLELVERYGKTDKEIPERIRGKRRLLGANSVSLMIARSDFPTQASEMRICSAALVEYDGVTLTVFEIGNRPLTPEEKKVLDEAQRIVKEYCEEFPYSDGWYWKEKHYIENSPFPYLLQEERNGKRLVYTNADEPRICDPAVRGNAILKYKVTFD